MSQVPKLVINIVGLQYRNVNDDFIAQIQPQKIEFTKEPKNKFDKFAVKAIFKDTHFGYVEQKYSKLFTALLNKNISFVIEIVQRDKFHLTLKVTFPNFSPITFQNGEWNSDLSGIYQVKFVSQALTRCYIGQSINIAKRLKQHQQDLNKFTHHNIEMQTAWIEDPKSFVTKLLYKSPEKSSALEKQIDLFKKEILFINQFISESVNAIQGDLVFTNESLKEFLEIIKVFKKRVSEKRALKLYQKEQLGKLILDVGIMDRISLPRTKEYVKDSNVLTWINKKRYGVLDYVPKIRSSVKGYEVLISSLKNLQNEIEEISRHKSYIESFKSTLIYKNDYFDTCSLEKLDQFFLIIEKYNSDISSKDVILRYKHRKFGMLDINECLLEIIDEKILKSIIP